MKDNFFFFFFFVSCCCLYQRAIVTVLVSCIYVCLFFLKPGFSFCETKHLSSIIKIKTVLIKKRKKKPGLCIWPFSGFYLSIFFFLLHVSVEWCMSLVMYCDVLCAFCRVTIASVWIKFDLDKCLVFFFFIQEIFSYFSYSNHDVSCKSKSFALEKI